MDRVDCFFRILSDYERRSGRVSVLFISQVRRSLITLPRHRTNGWFPDNVGGKPWVDGSRSTSISLFLILFCMLMWRQPPCGTLQRHRIDGFRHGPQTPQSAGWLCEYSLAFFGTSLMSCMLQRLCEDVGAMLRV